MTSRPIQQTPATGPAGKFPEFPPRDDMQNSIHLDDPAHQAVLRRHFGTSDTIIVLGEVPIGRDLRQRQGLRVPDLLVAFGVDRAGIISQRGYSIEEQGKPPDFVLEIASENRGQDDYTEKRYAHAAFGVPEYWRFDPSRTIAKSGSSSVEPGDGLRWAEGTAFGSQGHGHLGRKPSLEAQGIQCRVDQGGECLAQTGSAQGVNVLIPAAVLHMMLAVLNAPVVAEQLEQPSGPTLT